MFSSYEDGQDSQEREQEAAWEIWFDHNYDSKLRGSPLPAGRTSIADRGIPRLTNSRGPYLKKGA